MDKKIVKSVLTLSAAVVVAVGATFAAFTTNQVTIANNSMSAGDAVIKLCKATGANNWRNSVDPGLTLSGLVPGAAAVELNDNTIYIGNDDGTLNDALAEACASYFDTAGSSVVDMKLVPTTSYAPEDCTAADLDTHLKLAFTVDGTDPSVLPESDFKTLSEWLTNTDVLPEIFEPGEAQEVRMAGMLDEGATDAMKNQTCTFDVNFVGVQVDESGEVIEESEESVDA